MLVSKYLGYWMAAAVVDNILMDPFEAIEKCLSSSDYAVQFVAPRSIYTYRQLIAGFMGAVDAFLMDAQRTRKFEVEFLLRLSGKTQISEAIESVGYKRGDKSVCVCLFSRDEHKLLEVMQEIARCLGGTISEELERGALENVLNIYGITINELSVAAPSRQARKGELLILERIAMSGLS